MTKVRSAYLCCTFLFTRLLALGNRVAFFGMIHFEYISHTRSRRNTTGRYHLLPSITGISYQYPRVIHKRAYKLIKCTTLLFWHIWIVSFDSSGKKKLWACNLNFKFMKNLRLELKFPRQRMHILAKRKNLQVHWAMWFV